MASKTRVFPVDFSEPEPLRDHQVEGLKQVLGGFRALFQVLDDVLPTGDAKEAAIGALASAKRSADEAVRNHRPHLTFKRLVELFRPLESADRRVSKIVVNMSTFCDMRSEPSLADYLDLVTSRADVAVGLVGRFIGVDVYLSKRVPAGQIAVVAEDEDVAITPDWFLAFLGKI